LVHGALFCIIRHKALYKVTSESLHKGLPLSTNQTMRPNCTFQC